MSPFSTSLAIYRISSISLKNVTRSSHGPVSYTHLGLGASLVHHDLAAVPVTDFDMHLSAMLPFHRRYMTSNKACRLWANMARTLDIESIVPQHGRSFVGKQMVNQFIDWVEKLECGIDLMTQDNYKVP